MREENGGVLFPLQEDVIRTLKEGDVKILMLGVQPDPTRDAYDEPAAGMGLAYTRSQHTLQHDILAEVAEHEGSEEEFESSDDGSKLVVPALLNDYQFVTRGRAEFWTSCFGERFFRDSVPESNPPNQAKK